MREEVKKIKSVEEVIRNQPLHNLAAVLTSNPKESSTNTAPEAGERTDGLEVFDDE